jgi:hypothetical protein
MLANNRIDKLKTLAIYEIISITTKKGAIINGAPFGKNKEKKAKPWAKNPIKFKPKKLIYANIKVTAKWLVIVNANGINPIKFDNKTNNIIKKI